MEDALKQRTVMRYAILIVASTILFEDPERDLAFDDVEDPLNRDYGRQLSTGSLLLDAPDDDPRNRKVWGAGF